jgi:glutamate carboxypeptidase
MPQLASQNNNLNSNEKVKVLDEQEANSLLKTLAKINSGSLNKVGVDAVGHLFTDEFTKLGFIVKIYNHRTYGNLYYLQSPRVNTAIPKLLISGHLDTVFEPESGFTDVAEDKAYIYGPGVNDMKGGLVVALTAIQQAISEQGMPSNLGIVLCPDEELGSKAHADQLHKIYRQYDYAVVLEGAGDNYELCNQRKGVAQLSVVATGEAGHSGHWANRRRNAIDVLAECITHIISLADLSRGTSINTGYITGGGKLNIVAERAEAQFDIRYAKAREVERLENELRALSMHRSITYTLTQHFEPMEPNAKTEAFIQLIERAAKTTGQKVTFETRGSASDGNSMATAGIGVVDGFGVKGYEHHTHNEKMVKESLAKRARLLGAVVKQIQHNG